MRFYTQQHQYYCGIDLHARSIYLCIMDQAGKILLHRNMRATPSSFLKAVAPCREDAFESARPSAQYSDTADRLFAFIVYQSHS